MQSDVVVSDTAITGTLEYIENFAESGPLAGDGYYLALKFSNIDDRATSVMVGLDPSQGSGMAELITDPDKNGVWKITDKDTQVFVVESKNTSLGLTTRQVFSLAGLTLVNAVG